MTVTEIPGWKHVARGKVRDLYVPFGSTLFDADEVLVVASDRISAYDFSLSPEIPDKGRILTAMSIWWFDQLKDLVPNHLISATDVPAEVSGRAMRCQALSMIPLECVVRGYLTGSGLKDYTTSGQVGGHDLPAGLEDGSQLPQPLFTPSTKAEQGLHDENITVAEAGEQLGYDVVGKLEDLSLSIYSRAAEIARDAGIILADTKFEFGYSRHSGEVTLGDEVLTPDSSRFWDANEYRVGQAQPSFDKQFVRDYLTSPAAAWDRVNDNPPPSLPAEIVEKTRARYVEAYERLTGKTFV